MTAWLLTILQIAFVSSISCFSNSFTELIVGATNLVFNEINYKSSIKEALKSLSLDNSVAKISVIGMGMMSQSGVAEKMFKTLAKNSINILAISTSEIKISVLIDQKHTNIAVKSLHDAYNL